MSYDLDAIAGLFRRAADEGRFVLFEHEVYRVLACMGLDVPRHVFVSVDGVPAEKALAPLGEGRVVVKVVSPLITHKTEAGGVRLNVSPDAAVDAIAEMTRDVPATYAHWLVENAPMAGHLPRELLADPAAPEARVALEARIGESIAGFLLVEQVRYDAVFGGELMIGARSDRAFGPIVVLGTGGIHADFFNERLGAGEGFAVASAELLSDEAIGEFARRPAVYQALSGRMRSTRRQVTDDELVRVVRTFRDLAAAFSRTNAAATWSIVECEVNPYVAVRGILVPLDGVLRFEPNKPAPPARPYRKIGKLLEPKTVGLVGVSGRKPSPAGTILANLLSSGIRPEDVLIVHPHETEVQGCACVATWDELEARLGGRKLDLFVVGVAAEAQAGRSAEDVVEQLVARNLVEAILIISAGFGETERGQDRNERLRRMFADAHASADGGPVANGPNTLGNVFGRIDTRFTPRHKSSADDRGKRNCALICQSGAFMLARQSDLAGVLHPPVSISIGNQLDLTLSDYLKYLKDLEGVDVFGIYVEGFNELDGLEFARTAREIVASGRAIVVYKAGRTPEGKSAAKGHAAAVAGDYAVAKAVLEAAGVYVADELAEFQDMLKLCSLLADTTLDHSKQHAHIGAVSNAGFEKCAIGDNVQDDREKPLFKIATLDDSTLARVEETFARYRIADVVDVSEILDLTPIANDQTYADVVRAILSDKNVDAGIISIVPETAMLTTLDGIENEDIHDERSVANHLIRIRRETHKPFIVPIESGRLYEPMRELLQANDVPVFHLVDEATRTFGKYLRYRLKTGL